MTYIEHYSPGAPHHWNDALRFHWSGILACCCGRPLTKCKAQNSSYHIRCGHSCSVFAVLWHREEAVYKIFLSEHYWHLALKAASVVKCLRYRRKCWYWLAVSEYTSLCTDLIPCDLLATKWYPAASQLALLALTDITYLKSILCGSETLHRKLHCAATGNYYF